MDVLTLFSLESVLTIPSIYWWWFGSLVAVSLIFSRHYRHKLRQLGLMFAQKSAVQAQQFQQQRDYFMQENSNLKDDLHRADVAFDALQLESKTSFGELSAAREKIRQFEALQQEHRGVLMLLDETRAKNTALELALNSQKIRTQEQLSGAAEKIALLENAESRLQAQFERLAHQIFENKASSVDVQNRQSLETLLSPLKSQLDGFKKQVTDHFGEHAKERHTLIHEIKNLQQLNQAMAKEAVNLTQALKGDNKQQGNWGEVILARVLEESGLREGHEYATQVNLTNEEGKRFQPDVIVALPQKRNVVIDAKMALVAYERYFHAESVAEKDSALAEHVTTIRSHIRALGRKDYHQLHGIESLDYVLMFIPIEPAFQLAIEAEPDLIRQALDQNIMLVSPTTLLVALRTINNLWRYEQQNQNAQLIAEKAAKLYDKIRLFVEDIENLGGALNKASTSYSQAVNKLSQGRGNILRQTEDFRRLGVEVKKEISPTWLDAPNPHKEEVSSLVNLSK